MAPFFFNTVTIDINLFSAFLSSARFLGPPNGLATASSADIRRPDFDSTGISDDFYVASQDVSFA